MAFLFLLSFLSILCPLSVFHPLVLHLAPRVCLILSPRGKLNWGRWLKIHTQPLNECIMAVSPFGQRKPLKGFSTLKLPEQPRHNTYRRQRVFEKRRKGTLETATTNYTILPVFLSIFASIFFLSGLSHLPSTRLLTQTTPPSIKSLTSMFMLPQDQPCHFTTFPFVTTPGMFPLNQPLLPFTRHEAL